MTMPRVMKVVVLYDAGHTFTQAIYDYLMAFKKYSAHRVDFFNIDANHERRPDFSGYDAMIVNYCVTCVARHNPPQYVGIITPAIAAFRGLKIVVEQDPYDQTNAMKRFIIACGADAVITTIPAEHARYIYSESFFDDVHFETALTGFIDDDLVNAPAGKPLSERPIQLGYRGRETPWRIGDMGWHKSEIARRFKPACARRKIAHDIDYTERSRFHGEGWMHFVRSCRAMLGVPSGANVFDFDNSLHARIMKIWEADRRTTYADVRDMIEREAVPFDMGQVSPRVFEAVAAKTPLALLRGRYSGVIEPDAHYVPIEHDYSNVEQVLDRILDLDAMAEMAERAYAHVIDNPTYHFSWFVGSIDEMIDGSERAPANTDAPPLRVTDHPLGNDSYFIEKMFELRQDLIKMAQAIRQASEQKAVILPQIGQRTVHILPKPGHVLWQTPR